MHKKTNVTMTKTGYKKKRQETFIVTKRNLKSLLFRAYEYGANEVWRFDEWVDEQIENIRKKQGKL